MLVPLLVIIGVIALVVCVWSLSAWAKYLGLTAEDERRDREEDARQD